MHRQTLGMVQASQGSLVAQGGKLVAVQSLQRIAQGQRIKEVLVQSLAHEAAP